MTERFERAPYVDELVIDGESVVLLGQEVMRLGHLGTAILKALSTPNSVEEIAFSLELDFGRPEHADPITLTARAVSDLEVRGLVRISSDGRLRASAAN